MTEEKKETEVKEERKLTPLEETKEAISELKKEREEIAKIRDELQQLRSDQLLSGTAGINKPAPEPKEETAEEYADRVMKNKV